MTETQATKFQILFQEIARVPEPFPWQQALFRDIQDKDEGWPGAIEIKHGLSAKPSKGFHNAREDLTPARAFVVTAGEERYPIAHDVEAIGMRAMAGLVAGA